MSQHPSEFVAHNSEASNSDKKQALLDQTSFTQVYNMPWIDQDVLREFVPNDALVETIRTDLTAAREHAGFTQCVVNVTDNDKPGWHRVRIEASPLEDYVLNYDPDEHGDFDAYTQRFLHGSPLAPIEAQFHAEDESEADEEKHRMAETEDSPASSPLAEIYAEDTTDEDADTDSGPHRDENGRFVSAEADD